MHSFSFPEINIVRKIQSFNNTLRYYLWLKFSLVWDSSLKWSEKLSFTKYIRLISWMIDCAHHNSICSLKNKFTYISKEVTYHWKKKKKNNKKPSVRRIPFWTAFLSGDVAVQENISVVSEAIWIKLAHYNCME